MNPWLAYLLGVVTGVLLVPVVAGGIYLWDYLKHGQKGPGG